MTESVIPPWRVLGPPKPPMPDPRGQEKGRHMIDHNDSVVRVTVNATTWDGISRELEVCIDNRPTHCIDVQRRPYGRIDVWFAPHQPDGKHDE